MSRSMMCLECDDKLHGLDSKFCSIPCLNKYREKKMIDVKEDQARLCRECGNQHEMKGNYCSSKCKDIDSGSVQHPSHYNSGKFEVIDVIEDWSLGFNLGNAVKYVARAEHKGNELQDLKKAAWYMLRRIRERYPDKESDMEVLMEKLR